MTQTDNEKILKKYLLEYCDNSPTNYPTDLAGMLLDFGEGLEGFPIGIEEAYLSMNKLEQWNVVEYVVRKMKKKAECEMKEHTELLNNIKKLDIEIEELMQQKD